MSNIYITKDLVEQNNLKPEILNWILYSDVLKLTFADYLLNSVSYAQHSHWN